MKLPDEIAKVEDKISKLHEQIGDVSFYQQATELTDKTLFRLKELENKLDEMFTRWGYLEDKAKG